MTFDEIVRMALENKATDIHIEAGLPVVLRINGGLRRTATLLSRESIRSIADRLLPDNDWDQFQTRGSFDLTKIIGGVTCRINIMKSDRGIGMAIRLLTTSVNTLRSCNLHPQLAEFLERDHGLILLAGPTGSGKSTTLSAMLEEINQRSAKHIITLESPIEYRLQPKKSIIRQREVGVHTPTYEQGLMDCLREDPDVIVVGEMRDAESMRWTLNAAETGHLVIATMHASSSADAVYRMMMSFPPERQSTVLAQLADSLIAIVSQRMSFRTDPGILVPTLEILVGTHAVKHTIRKGEASKLISMLQTGGPEGNWTFERYQQWLDAKTEWVLPEPPAQRGRMDDLEISPSMDAPMPAESPKPRAPVAPAPASAAPKRPTRQPTPTPTASADSQDDAIEQMIAAQLREHPAASASPSARAERPSRVQPTQTSKPAGSREDAKVKVHKDGRIEIPDQEFDLEELVREFKGRGEEI